MLRRIMSTLAMMVLLTLVNFSNTKPQGEPLNSEQSESFKLDEGVNEFAKRLYREWSQDSNGNIVISPLSIHMALAMTLYGSPEESTTNLELLKVLGMDAKYYKEYSYNFLQVLNHYNDISQARQSTATIGIANKLYYDQSLALKSDYASFLRAIFLSPGEKVDFSQSTSSVNAINQFVSQITEGKIQDLMSSRDVSALTKVVLVNAIYFKASWLNAFDAFKTRPAPFRVSPNEAYDYATTMTQKGQFGTLELAQAGVSILELPYTTPDLKTFIILPNEDVDIRDVDLDLIDLSSVNQQLQYGTRTVQLPKFKAESKAELVPLLKRMGLTAAFDEAQADFTDIAEEELALSKVIHQAVLDVNEEGSEAAAATAGVIDVRVASRVFKDFIVDRPFLMVIFDSKHNLPLFYARIVDPEGVRTLTPFDSLRQGQLATPNTRSSSASTELQGELGQRNDCNQDTGFDRNGQKGEIQFPCPSNLNN